MQTATIEYEGKNIGVEYKDGKLYAGFIFNAGISHDWEIDYDKNRSWDENLQDLCDVITENWEE